LLYEAASSHPSSAAAHGIASLLIDKGKQDAARHRAGAMRSICALEKHTRAAVRLGLGGLLKAPH